ncbi:RNA polymerase II subunit A C-terminal domain phosphatase [Clonorchis sinensis]|uniref:protein-serine/threonine phosphatase n=1 Tax=Clonorchis sinensis TaxID=79923 RepID=G7YGA0_CLOSI|nr:RNA polymerase II subunit A C-terminal domain phosphatase [Clonorchis sinensis]
MRRTLKGLQITGVQLAYEENLIDLEHADDIVLIFEEKEKAQVSLDELTKVIPSFVIAFVILAYSTFSLSPMESSVICAPQDPQVYFQVHWKIKRRQVVTPSTVVCTLGGRGSAPLSIYAPGFGWATALLQDESIVAAGEGGLSGERIEDASAKIPMVHAVPDLHVSESVAAELALQDEQSLLAARKLVLLVDLDETVLHTTNDPQAYRYKNVSRYCLPGSPLVYHTSFRPHLKAVLDRLSKYYQMHICTFGNRMYAHQLAGMIDPKRRYFSHRILSRDECFNPVTKSANLKALFPRGLNLVCIIDDRGEVWEWSPHLIQVKPYRFFQDACDTKHFAWSSPSGRQEKLPSVSESVAVSSPPVTSETTESVKTNGTDPPAACSTQLPSEPVDEAASQPKTHLTSDSQIDEIPAASDDSSPKTEGDKPERDGCTESPLKSVVEADPEPDSPPPSEETHVPVTPEELFEAADGNYLLRLQDILISLHRSYFREYDRWRARKASVNTRMVRQRDDTCDQESSSPSLSSSPSSPLPSSDHQHTETGCVPNLAHIIAQHRANVLGPDCHITLSGLAPSHLPERCFAARIARNLGAVLHGGLRLPSPQSVPVSEESVGVTQSTHKEHSASPVKNLEHEDLVHPPGPRNVYTTHLIACRRGTEKHNAATEFLRTWPSDVSAPPLHIVSPHWLWACHFHWTRFPESDFPLVHDYHPSEFDPELEPAPGTFRCDSTPRLDVSMVQSALESIRAERKLDKQRKHEQHRRRRHSGSSAHVAPPKRHRTYSSQDHNASQSLEPADTNQITPSGEQESKVDKESGSSSPSLSSSEDEQKQPQTRDASRQDSAEIASQDSAAAIVPNPKGHTVDLTEFHKTEEPPHGSGTLVEIRDADEGTEDETLDYVLPGDTVEDEDEEEEGTTESETAIESNLSAFLPPPKALILADNPLLHLPPQATSQMLAEIEDAVMEEDTEKAASVPVEAELFDPAKLGVCNTDSSLSSSEQDVTEEGAEQVEDMIQLHEEDRIPAQRPRIRRSRSPMRRVDPVELDQRALQCQVQRELLLRRRCRASPEETRKIDRKLHRLDAYLRREDWRRRSADDLAFAKSSAQERNQWLLVSLHDESCFDCHLMNRDVWKDPRVYQTVKKNFTFLQISVDSPEGFRFRSRYSYVTSASHIAVLDPTTGEQKVMWMHLKDPNTVNEVLTTKPFDGFYPTTGEQKVMWMHLKDPNTVNEVLTEFLRHNKTPIPSGSSVSGNRRPAETDADPCVTTLYPLKRPRTEQAVGDSSSLLSRVAAVSSQIDEKGSNSIGSQPSCSRSSPLSRIDATNNPLDLTEEEQLQLAIEASKAETTVSSRLPSSKSRTKCSDVDRSAPWAASDADDELIVLTDDETDSSVEEDGRDPECFIYDPDTPRAASVSTTAMISGRRPLHPTSGSCPVPSTVSMSTASFAPAPPTSHSTLLPLPVPGPNEDVMELVVRLPSGEREILRLSSNLQLQVLREHFNSRGFPHSRYEFVRLYPRTSLSSLPDKTRLDEAGLSKKDTVFLQEI